MIIIGDWQLFSSAQNESSGTPDGAASPSAARPSSSGPMPPFRSTSTVEPQPTTRTAWASLLRTAHIGRRQHGTGGDGGDDSDETRFSGGGGRRFLVGSDETGDSETGDSGGGGGGCGFFDGTDETSVIGSGGSCLANETSASGGASSLTAGANAAGVVPTVALAALSLLLLLKLWQAKRNVKAIMKAAVVAAERAGGQQAAAAMTEAVNEAAGVVEKDDGKNKQPKKRNCRRLLIMTIFVIGAVLAFCGIFVCKKDWAKFTCFGLGTAVLGGLLVYVIVSGNPNLLELAGSSATRTGKAPDDLTFWSFLMNMSGPYCFFFGSCSFSKCVWFVHGFLCPSRGLCSFTYASIGGFFGGAYWIGKQSLFGLPPNGGGSQIGEIGEYDQFQDRGGSEGEDQEIGVKGCRN